MSNVIDDHRITHVGLVIDESYSMRIHQAALMTAFDNVVGGLARRSKELGEEVRVSVWSFSGRLYVRNAPVRSRGGIDALDPVKCLVWDMDVFRLPSLSEKGYSPHGNTALIDGTMRAITDLESVPEKYGDHSFLLFVLTDGEENNSYHTSRDLRTKIESLPAHWTVAALVPNAFGVSSAKTFGFPDGNVEKWAADDEYGTHVVGETVVAATSSYLEDRASGVRGTKTLFVDTSAKSVNRENVKAIMRPADPASYILHFIPPVTHPFPKALSRRAKFRIDEYVKNTLGLPFVVGRNYYELIRSESVQPQKDIAVVDRKTDEVFIGREARDLIGLPGNATTRVRPDFNDQYRIFIRSDSTNRNLLEGQRVLIIK
jgi:hypothetical protein